MTTKKQENFNMWFLDRSDPIRRQLLGATPTGKYGYTAPKPEDIPLRAWIEEHLGMDAVVPGIGM